MTVPRTVLGELLAWLWWIAAAVAFIAPVAFIAMAVVEPGNAIPDLAAAAIHLAVGVGLVVGRRLVRRARRARARTRALPSARVVRR